jgi:hypothetical protein
MYNTTNYPNLHNKLHEADLVNIVTAQFYAPVSYLDKHHEVRQGISVGVVTREVFILILAWTLTIFRDFPMSLQANAVMVPLIRPRPLPSLSFSVHYSLSSNHSTLYTFIY